MNGRISDRRTDENDVIKFADNEVIRIASCFIIDSQIQRGFRHICAHIQTQIRQCHAFWVQWAVASLGWVTPEAATEGVNPLFFPEKPVSTFFSRHSAVSPLISSSQKLTTFFCSSFYRFLLLSLGCHPLEGVTLHLFLPVRPRFSTILCKFAHKIFFLRVPPPWRVSLRAVRPPRPLVTPLAVGTNARREMV